MMKIAVNAISAKVGGAATYLENVLPALRDRLVDQGNTVVVIEHNLEVIKTADWIVDIGPEGGDKGGTIIAEGTPEDVSKVKGSYTAQYLAPLLKAHVKVTRKRA